MTVSPPLVDTDATRAWGERLGRMLRAGDLVILTGGLGAGKTTLTQGMAEGLGVRGPITSPTFVISRVHPSVSGGPVLVHVDAYRLGGLDELDDLDLDADLDRAVTVVEWGHGLAEDLATDSLEVTLEGESVRTATVVARGDRWATAEAQTALSALGAPIESNEASEPNEPSEPSGASGSGGTNLPIGRFVPSGGVVPDGFGRDGFGRDGFGRGGFGRGGAVPGGVVPGDDAAMGTGS